MNRHHNCTVHYSYYVRMYACTYVRYCSNILSHSLNTLCLPYVQNLQGHLTQVFKLGATWKLLYTLFIRQNLSTQLHPMSYGATADSTFFYEPEK